MFRRFRSALLALLASTTLAWALTNPATIAPRNFATQQVGYLRINVVATGSGISANGNPCVAAATGGGNCYVKAGALPANAYLIRLNLQIVTNFDADTSDTLSLGTNTTATNIVGATTVHAGAGDAADTAFVAGGSGTLLTTGVAQTGANGGYDVYVKYVYTAATVATTGQAVFVLEYIAPNDGTCVDTPMGVTPTSC